MTISDILQVFELPKREINLMFGSVSARDPFYADITHEFFEQARRRHRKFPLVGALTCGVALCDLVRPDAAYVRMIEPSARRNVKKAQRLGYSFQAIDYNAYLDDIKAIRQSADVRQGKLDADFLVGDVAPCRNPQPLTQTHAYPYFGVVKDGHLFAYAGVLVAGELAMIEHIYGHAAHHSDGVVPLLLAGIAKYLEKHYPSVKYYGYGSYFGASATMRRFKRKFQFMPHRVKWALG